MSETETVTETSNGAVAEAAKEETKTSYDGSAIRGARKEEKAEAKETETKRPGYDPVDLETASPEQVKERLNYLYRQVKDGGKVTNEYRKIAEQQSRQIEELTRVSNTVVTHLQTKSLDDSEGAIKAQMDDAFTRGDNKAYMEAQQKLIDLGVEKRLAKAAPVAQPKQTKSAQPMDARELATRAEEGGELTPSQVNYTAAWQDERDENGSLLRPWSKTPDMNNPDPQFSAALRETQGVFSNPRYEHLSYEEKLAEVDKRMGVAKRVTSQTVSGGGLTGRAKTSKITLSADIEKMVRVTKWGGSKFKSDEERLEGYRKQLQKVKGTR